MHNPCHCRHCGHCPTCGQSMPYAGPYPYYPPSTWPFIVGPYIHPTALPIVVQPSGIYVGDPWPPGWALTTINPVIPVTTNTVSHT